MKKKNRLLHSRIQRNKHQKHNPIKSTINFCLHYNILTDSRTSETGCVTTCLSVGEGGKKKGAYLILSEQTIATLFTFEYEGG